jgi:cytochrome c peroxidase
VPADLDKYIASRERAIALGKALFWEMQVGSDGRTACATCHWHAGADLRLKNSVHPGAPGSNFGPQYPQSAALFTAAVGKFRGANKTLKADDFPFHKVLQPLAPADRQGQPSKGNPVLRDTREIAGSQGVLTEDFIALLRGKSADLGRPVLNPVFSMHGVNVRQVTGRNSPTTINAVYFDRLFWDGRASRYFNGVNPFGDLDPDASVYCADAGGSMKKVSIRIDNAALASQATGPVISPVEMSWDGRRFSELARKLLPLRPLALQKVAPDDSVLGCFCDASGHGLCSKKTSYSQLIREAFKPEWWSGRRLTPEGFTHMEANFSLYWGLAIMMYESTLVSDQAPYDRWAAGDRAALSPLAKEGLKIFMNEGRCINCHSGPEFAGATVSELRGVLSNDGVVEKMQMSAGIAVYDGGFYNIGVRPTFEDIGVGAAHPLFGPLSYSRQEQLGRNPEPKVVVSRDQRLAVNGAFKTPTLRNISLTGPYMHNGGMKSLREVVEFYVRGGDFPDQNRQDLAPDIRPIEGMYGREFKVDALVEFLEHLTDERVRKQKAPFDHPQLVIPNGHAEECYEEALDQLIVIPANGREGGEGLWKFEQTLERGMQWRAGSGGYSDRKYEPGPVNDIPPAELIPGDYRPQPPVSAVKSPTVDTVTRPGYWQE